MEGEILEIQERLETITEEGTIYPTQRMEMLMVCLENGRREYLSKKMIKKSEILSIKISGALSEGHNK